MYKELGGCSFVPRTQDCFSWVSIEEINLGTSGKPWDTARSRTDPQRYITFNPLFAKFNDKCIALFPLRCSLEAGNRGRPGSNVLKGKRTLGYLMVR